MIHVIIVRNIRTGLALEIFDDCGNFAPSVLGSLRWAESYVVESGKGGWPRGIVGLLVI